QLENLLALVADQRELVVHRLGGGRFAAFQLVLDRLDQGGLGEVFVFLVVVLAHVGFLIDYRRQSPAGPGRSGGRWSTRFAGWRRRTHRSRWPACSSPAPTIRSGRNRVPRPVAPGGAAAPCPRPGHGPRG